ncbi:MAG: hypothetical protein DRJ50_01490 [Actinobacteria bacterium]|nr:MAG: hypothetical protein DRJ50_01490 [Actinomycetota bacterium]
MADEDDRSRPLFLRPLDAIASAVVPPVADAVDLDELIDRVDVNGLLERIDVDALLDRIDVDAVLERVDLDKLIARLDVNAIVERVDIDAIIEGVDVDAIADRVDVERVADRVDVNAIADSVDIDRILQRSTKGVSDRFIDLFRRQIVGIDEITMRVLSRLLRRDPDSLPAGPPSIVETGESVGTMSGRYAGPLSRLGALLLDVFLISTTFTLLAAGTQFLFRRVLGIDVDFGDWATPLVVVAMAIYGILYFWISQAVTGRTIAQAIVGLKVVQGDGTPLKPGHALVRTLVLPFSFVLFGIGALMVLVDRRRRALHDLAAKSAVVYDWGDRPAALPAPLTRYLDKRESVTLDIAPNGSND